MIWKGEFGSPSDFKKSFLDFSCWFKLCYWQMFSHFWCPDDFSVVLSFLQHEEYFVVTYAVLIHWSDNNTDDQKGLVITSIMAVLSRSLDCVWPMLTICLWGRHISSCCGKRKCCNIAKHQLQRLIGFETKH